MGKIIFGQIGKLKKNKIDEYCRLHAATWPDVLKTISECNLRNYSIFIHEDLVFSYFEYTGKDYEADMKKMAQDEVTQEWWNHTKPCFEKFAMDPKSEFYHDMKQIFHFNGGDRMGIGKKVWVFPDAELPPEGADLIPGHESVIITNPNERDANVKVTLFYTDRDPVTDIKVTVGSKRVRCLRTNESADFGEHTAVIGEQYAIMLESDTPVIAQYGRAEPRSVNFYTTPGYFE